MAAQISWPRILAEGLAIVSSILLAFGIQAWWEGAQNRREGQELLAGLEADVAASANDLHTTMETQDAIIAAIFDLEQMSEAQAAEVEQPEALRPFNRVLQSLRTFQPQDATLRAIISSGKLDLIENAQLRDMLIRWQSLIEDSEEQAEDFRVAGNRVIQKMAYLGGPWRIPGPPGGALGSFPWTAPHMSRLPLLDLTRVKQDEEIMSLLRDKRFRGMSYLYALGRVESVGDSLLSMIEADRS